MQAVSDMHMIRRLAILALAGALALVLGGCAGSGPADADDEPAASDATAVEASPSEAADEAEGDEELSEPAEMLLYVGADTATTSSVIVRNELGADITFVSIAPTGSEDEPTSLSIEGGTWNDGRMVALFFEPAEGASTYDLVFTAGGEFYDLPAADLDSNREVVLKANGTAAYLEPVQR